MNTGKNEIFTKNGKNMQKSKNNIIFEKQAIKTIRNTIVKTIMSNMPKSLLK